MELDEYRRMAETESTHWWYAATRALIRQELGPHLRAGGRFLDAGCGTGATGAWMEERGHVVGTDLAPLALKLYGDAHRAGGLAVADVQRLPFAPGSFDAVLCVTVLCHRSIASPAAVVAELTRVLAPGGVLALWEPGIRRLRRAHDRVTHSARRFSRLDLARMCTASGLEVVRSTGAHAYLVPAAAAKAVLERGRVASDLDSHQTGLCGVLARIAAAERFALRHTTLPAGLSVLAIARKPGATERWDALGPPAAPRCPNGRE